MFIDMKTWNDLRIQAYRIMLNCSNVYRDKRGYIYYCIGGKQYKRSDLMKLVAEVAQKRYKLSRFNNNQNTQTL
jgi:hypothetical protein